MKWREELKSKELIYIGCWLSGGEGENNSADCKLKSKVRTFSSL